VLPLNTEDVVGVAPTHGVCFVIMHKYDNPSLAVFYPASQHLGGIMKVGGHMANAKREPIMGSWGRVPG